MPLTKEQAAELTVLVVDDEQFMRQLISLVLKEIGITKIVEARDGAHGLNTLAREEETPDIIICDLEMPGIDGFEFVKKLRAAKNPKFKDLPVLIVTGHADSENVVSAVQAGIHGYVVKPVSRNILEQRIDAALSSGPIDPSRMKG